IQMYVKIDFLYFLVAGARTSVGRGVPNLTSEPSFYGFMIIFALLFVLDFNKSKNIYILNLLIQLFLFAQSSVGILYLGIFILIVIVKHLRVIKLSTFIRSAGVAGLFVIVIITIF